MAKKVYKIGFLGMGTIAQGVYKHLTKKKSALEKEFDAKYELVKVCDLDFTKALELGIPREKLTKNALDVVDDPEIDIVCELIGGVNAAFDFTMRALKNGKVVVSANKAVICEKGKQIFEASNFESYFFEASVGGSIPIIKVVREALVANKFEHIYGILNGTCNYILTRMANEGSPFEEILADAKKLGYAEANDTLDVDGFDTAHKAVILTYLATGKWIKQSQMIIEGIRQVKQQDIKWAKENGYSIKLVASVNTRFRGKKVFTSVRPALVARDSVLGNVNGVYNAVAVEGDLIGTGIYIGKGAGQDPTSSAVISDIFDAIKYLKGGPKIGDLCEHDDIKIADLEEVKGVYYVRICVKDKPGVLAGIAEKFARHGISIELMEQSKHDEPSKAWLIMITHQTNEKAIKGLFADLKKTTVVQDNPFVLRIFE